MLKVADAEGRLAEAEAMFGGWPTSSWRSRVQDDPLIELLDLGCSLPRMSGVRLTTGDLFHRLKTHAGLSHPPREFEIKSAIAFGKYLQELKGTLRELFGASERPGRAGTRLVDFQPH